MKLLWNAKDGGPESKVWCWGVESKWLGSLLILKFEEGSREAFHTHAFNAVSWLLSGALLEHHLDGTTDLHHPSWQPIRTYRETFHKVDGLGEKSWVFSMRGPWVATWREFLPKAQRFLTLTHGRKEITE